MREAFRATFWPPPLVRLALGLLFALLGPAHPVAAAPPADPRLEPGAAEAAANVVGSVRDEVGQPVARATVELIDAQGAVVAWRETGQAGRYRMDCVAPGRYQLRLRPGTDGFQGQTVVMPLDPRGVRVDWTVAANKPALALAVVTGAGCMAEAAVGAAAAGFVGADGGVAGYRDDTSAKDVQFWARLGSVVGGGSLVGGVAAGIGLSGGGGASGGGAPQSPSQ